MRIGIRLGIATWLAVIVTVLLAGALVGGCGAVPTRPARGVAPQGETALSEALSACDDVPAHRTRREHGVMLADGTVVLCM